MEGSSSTSRSCTDAAWHATSRRRSILNRTLAVDWPCARRGPRTVEVMSTASQGPGRDVRPRHSSLRSSLVTAGAIVVVGLAGGVAVGADISASSTRPTTPASRLQYEQPAIWRHRPRSSTCTSTAPTTTAPATTAAPITPADPTTTAAVTSARCSPSMPPAPSPSTRSAGRCGSRRSLPPVDGPGSWSRVRPHGRRHVHRRHTLAALRGDPQRRRVHHRAGRELIQRPPRRPEAVIRTTRDEHEDDEHEDEEHEGGR